MLHNFGGNMSKILLTEEFFSGIAKRVGTLWGVIKGQFWRSIRTWITVYQIWNAESSEEISKIVTKGREDIDKIKTRYRSFEQQFAEDNGIFNSTYGNFMLFTNPPAALAYHLYNTYLMDESYTSDVKRVLIDSGFGDEKMFPRLSKYLKDSRAEDPSGRFVQTDPETGKKTETIVYKYQNSSNQQLKNAAESIESIAQIFSGKPASSAPTKTTVAEANLREQKESRKEEAKRVTTQLLKDLKDRGVMDDFEKIGAEILKVKQAQYQEILVPASVTIEKMSDLAVAKSIEEFKKIMKDLKATNKLLKKLDSDEFDKQIENAAFQIQKNKKLMDLLRKEYDKEEFDPEEMKEIVFLQSRDVFTSSVVGYLEDIYEGLRSMILEGVTEKGLKKMKSNAFGKQYANSVEENIQLLDKAVLSLKKLDESTGE